MVNERLINVTQFLHQYETENTKINYKVGIKQFFNHIYPTLKNENLDTKAEKYMSEKRDYQEDILNFKDSLHDKAPSTKGSRLNAVKVFLANNGIKFPKLFFRNMNGKNVDSITWEKVPSNNELKRIIEYLPLQGKALTLVLSSSGMQIRETVRIRLGDIEFNHDPVKIKIQGEHTKTGKKRITFISPEAKEAVQEWLKYRDKYMERAKGRTPKVFRKNKGDLLFPFRSENFNVIWRNALDKANLLEIDKKTNRIMMRPHNLRKFFRLRVGRYGQDEAEAMMGHQTGLNAIYARFDDVEERLEEVYKKSIPDLSINQKGIQVNEVLNNTIKELKEKIENNEKKRLDVYTKLVFITAKLEDLMIKDEKRTKEIEELKRDLHNWKMTVQDFEKIIHHLISKNRKLTAEEEE